mgnify:CR=1 FL=1
MLFSQVIGQVVGHALELNRMERQSEIAQRQAQLLHELRLQETGRAHQYRLDEADHLHGLRLEETAQAHGYRLTEIERQHHNALERDQLQFVHAIQMEDYRHGLRRADKAEDRELANSPFRWTLAELRERVANTTGNGQRPLLLVAPFQPEDDERGRVSQDRQRFRRILTRTWNRQP